MKITKEILLTLQAEDSSFEHVQWKNEVIKEILSNAEKLDSYHYEKQVDKLQQEIKQLKEKKRKDVYMCQEWVGGGGDMVNWFFTTDENLVEEWENSDGNPHKRKDYDSSHTNVELIELI